MLPSGRGLRPVKATKKKLELFLSATTFFSYVLFTNPLLYFRTSSIGFWSVYMLTKKNIFTVLYVLHFFKIGVILDKCLVQDIFFFSCHAPSSTYRDC